MDTRPMPGDAEAERILLGYLIHFPDLVDECRDKLVSSDFVLDAHSAIYEVIMSGKKEVDPVIIYNELKNKKCFTGEPLVSLQYLLGIDDGIFTRRLAPNYIEIIRKKSLARQVIERSTQLIDNCYRDWDDVRRSLEVSSMELIKFHESARFLSGEKIFDSVQKGKDYLAERLGEREKTPKIPVTGWSRFNHKLGGGFKRGRVYVVAARPSSGKTSFIVHLCANFCYQALPGVMVQIENPEYDIYDKLAANICTYDSEQIADNPDYLTPEKKERIKDAIEGASRYFHIEHKSSMTVHEICQRIYAYKTQREVQWFMVDYLQRIEGDKRKNELENITYNIRVLDDLAEKLNMVCILISMANRDAEGGKIRMKHMKGSGEIEQDADVLMAIQSDEAKADQDVEDIDLEIIKNRYGRKGKIPMIFQKASSQFTEKDDRY